MGGCSPSKMSRSADVSEDALHPGGVPRFGYPASMRNGTKPTKTHNQPAFPSSNASGFRIESLAGVMDPAYATVKGGREPSHPNALRPHYHFRDAESQTARSLPVNPPTDLRASRPANFGLNADGSKGSLSARAHLAPLATIETASELGTPTPMDENRSLIKSFLHAPSRLAAPRSQLTLANRLPSNASNSSQIMRPSQPPPRPPMASRSIQPPSNLSNKGRNGTDNVMINQGPSGPLRSQSALSQLPQPGTLSSTAIIRPKNNTKDETQRPIGLSNCYNSQRQLNNATVAKSAKEPTRMDDPDASASLNHPPIVLPVARLPTVPPNSKLKFAPNQTAASTMGNAPRGPLAEHNQSRNGQAVCQTDLSKTFRKFPTNPIVPSVFEKQNSYEENGAKEAMARRNSRDENFDSRRSSQLSSTSLLNGYTRDHEAVAGNRSSAEDIRGPFSAVPKDREALAPMGNQSVFEPELISVLLEELNAMRSLAEQLLSPPPKNFAGGDFMLESAALDDVFIDDLLSPPSQEVLQNPKAAEELIKRLQATVRHLQIRNGQFR